MTSTENNPAENRRNLDIECLKCGAFNIAENQVCGRCGANLPLVYDEEGKIFNWRQSPHYAALVGKAPQKNFKAHPGASRMILRLGLLLFAAFVVLWIVRHR